MSSCYKPITTNIKFYKYFGGKLCCSVFLIQIAQSNSGNFEYQISNDFSQVSHILVHSQYTQAIYTASLDISLSISCTFDPKMAYWAIFWWAQLLFKTMVLCGYIYSGFSCGNWDPAIHVRINYIIALRSSNTSNTQNSIETDGPS